MTRFRAFVAANVGLVIVALLLISTEWRKDARTVDVPRGIGALSQAELQAALAQMQTTTDTYREIIAPTVPDVSTMPVHPVTRPKPPIVGPDLMTGERVALSQFRGRPVFVSVWGSWNVGSTAQASTIANFARSHGEVAFLGVDSEDSKAAARAFSTRFHLDFPTIWDPIGKLGAWAPVPTTLVFDRRHALAQRIEGSASLAQLNVALRRATRP